MNKIYYSQVDNRWKDYPYPSQELPKATIGSGGCGAAVGAMVVSMLKEIVTPIEIADKFLKDGIRVNGGTSNKAFDSYLTEQYGLEVELKWKIAEAKECLENGGLVVALCTSSKGNLFTTGGHFILLVGYENNEFLVYDPYLYQNKFNSYGRNGKARIEGTNVYVTYENMKEYGGYNQLWCYKATGIDTNIDTTIPKTEIVNYDRGTVGKINKLANATKLYENSDLSGTQYDYLAKTSFEILENVSEYVDKIRVIKTNRVAYVDIRNYENQVQTNSYIVKTVIAKSGLNVRKGAGTNYGIVTCYKNGTRVKVYSEENGWSKGTKGYMYSKYLK